MFFFDKNHLFFPFDEREEKIYCSDKCRMSWWNTNRRTAGRTEFLKICFHCKNKFSTAIKKQKYCSHECYIQ